MTIEDNSEKTFRESLDPKGKIIYNFLSRLADQYNKNSFWRRNQQSLYERKFAQIPNDFLKQVFLKYLTDEMPDFLPTLPKIYEFVKAQRGFKTHWEFHYRGGLFCVNCRTDKDFEGHTGGYRNVFIWGYKNGVPTGRMHLAKCDCEAGMTLAGPSYLELMESMQAKHEDAEITYSYWDGKRQVDSKSQSSFAWEERVHRGTVFRDPEGGYIPNWEHPIWISSVGLRLLKIHNIQIPPEIQIQVDKKIKEDARKLETQNRAFRKKQRQTDGYVGSYPKSIASIIGE